MVSISLLLHLHQPPTQFPEVLRRVADQCYRPLFHLLSKYPEAHLTINLTRSLIEQLESQNLADDVIPLLNEAVVRGQVELTGTAAYHILLPKLSKEEVIRQIKLEEETISKYFSVDVPVRGFFPPEMGIDQASAELISDLGYQWVIVDEGAVGSRSNIKDQISKVSGKNRKGREILVVVRNKELSLKLAFGVVTTVEAFLAAAKPSTLYPNPSLVLAMDGETFGHHQPALMPFLEDLMKLSGREDFRMITISEMVDEQIRAKLCPESVSILSSTWSDDWLKWANPENEIHVLQWKLTALAIKTVNESRYAKAIANLKSQISNRQLKSQNSERSEFSDTALTSDLCDLRSGGGAPGNCSPEEIAWLQARKLLDRALHSDQYWWASLRPNWHYQIVERGGRMLRDVVLAVPEVDGDAKLEAEQMYEQITKTGLKKYGETVIV